MSLENKMDAIKKAFPTILKDKLGNVTDACNLLGCSRSWYYGMRHEDPEFKALCDEAHEVVLDFVESHLFKQIKADVPASTIFFLKTRGKDRGYIERSEFSGKDGGPIEIKALTEPQEKMVERGLADLEAAAVARYKASLEAPCEGGDNGVV